MARSSCELDPWKAYHPFWRPHRRDSSHLWCDMVTTFIVIWFAAVSVILDRLEIPTTKQGIFQSFKDSNNTDVTGRFVGHLQKSLHKFWFINILFIACPGSELRRRIIRNYRRVRIHDSIVRVIVFMPFPFFLSLVCHETFLLGFVSFRILLFYVFEVIF